MTFRASSLVAAAMFMWIGCGRQAATRRADSQAAPSALPWFQDITQRCKLNFVQEPGPTGSYFMPQIMGSGGAMFDFDNDGRLDIYLIHNGGPKGHKNQLFHQEQDGTFNDVSAGSGLDVAGYGMGVAIGDVNNDGLPDVLLTEYGHVRLFLNNGNGTFTDITQQAGIVDSSWATSAAFADYDRDGLLDLVVTHYLAYDPSRPCAETDGKPDYCGPTAFDGVVTRLYHNLGGPVRRSVSGCRSDGVTGSASDGNAPPPPRRASSSTVPRFEDVTFSAGLANKPGPGLAVVCLDFDGDGWPDIFVANDGKPNYLWMNQRNGTFTEEAVQRGLAFNLLGHFEGNMGIAVGDTTGSGLFDLFVTHLTSENNTFWRQISPGNFTDRSAAAGIATEQRGTGFGTVMADFDLDGNIDLALVNGRVNRAAPAIGSAPPASAPGSFWDSYVERSQLFANDGAGRMLDISDANPAFCGQAHVARGLVTGDLFNDGSMDLLVTVVGDSARLLKNVVARQNKHWLEVRAVLPRAGGRDAYGARVAVTAEGKRHTRWVTPAGSYLSSADPRCHFGLGTTRRVDTVEILWPDGNLESFVPPEVDRLVVLAQGEGRGVAR